MALEETVEKDMIPLVFSGSMNFDGSWDYRRLDTGDIVDGEYVEILEPLLTVELVKYVSSSLWEKAEGKGRIRMTPVLGEANALLLDKKSEIEQGIGVSSLYSTQYCEFKKK